MWADNECISLEWESVTNLGGEDLRFHVLPDGVSYDSYVSVNGSDRFTQYCGTWGISIEPQTHYTGRLTHYDTSALPFIDIPLVKGDLTTKYNNRGGRILGGLLAAIILLFVGIAFIGERYGTRAPTPGHDGKTILCHGRYQVICF